MVFNIEITTIVEENGEVRAILVGTDLNTVNTLLILEAAVEQLKKQLPD